MKKNFIMNLKLLIPLYFIETMSLLNFFLVKHRVYYDVKYWVGIEQTVFKTKGNFLIKHLFPVLVNDLQFVRMRKVI